MSQITRIISAVDASFSVAAVDKAASSEVQSRLGVQAPYATPISDVASVKKTSDRESVNDIRAELERKGMEFSTINRNELSDQAGGALRFYCSVCSNDLLRNMH